MATARGGGGRALGQLVRVVLPALLVTCVLGVGYIVHVAARSGDPVDLPSPVGHYPIGRTTVTWTESGRVDPLSPVPGQPRRLAVWIWYPATTSAKTMPRAAYAPGPWARLHLTGLLGWSETGLDRVQVHAHDGAPVAHGRFPTVVFEPGLGFAALQYSAVAESLASGGFVVVGVTPTFSANHTVLNGDAVAQSPAGNPATLEAADVHSGQAAVDGARLVEVWADDANFAASTTRSLGRASTGLLAGHIDDGRVGYLGHSLGGSAALRACDRDRRCQATADLDGTQFGVVVDHGIRAPLLIISSATSCIGGVCRAMSAGDRADQDIANRFIDHCSGAVWRLQIHGAKHFNFTDYGIYYAPSPVRRLLALGSIDGGRALDITNIYLAAFFNHTLHEDPESLLSSPDPRFPEVAYG